jgi:hypothetical protein
MRAVFIGMAEMDKTSRKASARLSSLRPSLNDLKVLSMGAGSETSKPDIARAIDVYGKVGSKYHRN